MLSLLSFVATAALLSLGGPALGHILDKTKLDVDNNLLPEIPQPRRVIKQYVQILSAPHPALSAASGELIRLECQAIGSPAPRIVWLRDGERVINPQDETEILPQVGGVAQLRSRLVVLASRRREVFTCMASVGHRHVSASTVLFVDGDKQADPLEALESPPVITTSYEDVIQEIGSHIALPCRARAHEDAQTHWTDNKNEPLYDSDRFTILPSGDLVIRSLSWEDMGRFTCTVTDRFGEDTAHTFIYPFTPTRQ